MKKLKHLRSKFAVQACGLWILPLAAFVCTTTIYAQADPDAAAQSGTPSGPLLATAANMSQWTITYTYSGEQSGKAANANIDPSKPRTIVTTKTGDIIHEETTTVSGTKLDSWQVHGDYYIKYPGNNYWSAFEKAGSSSDAQARADVVLPSTGFRGLDWIKKDAYAGKITASAGENLVFVPGGIKVVNAANSNAQQKLDSLPTIAYVNAETRLPVMARGPGETRQYTFNQPGPTSPQIPPDDLLAEIKQGEAIRTKRQGAPAAEY